MYTTKRTNKNLVDGNAFNAIGDPYKTRPENPFRQGVKGEVRLLVFPSPLLPFSPSPHLSPSLLLSPSPFLSFSPRLPFSPLLQKLKHFESTQHPKNEDNGHFSKLTYHSEEYKDGNKYITTQPLAQRKYDKSLTCFALHYYVILIHKGLHLHQERVRLEGRAQARRVRELRPH
jgi:hypothetical protein